MWRFKFLLIGVLISGALGAVLFFVGRYVYDEFRSELRQDAITAVDDYFATNRLGPITEERIVITERELTDALRRTDELSSTFDEQGLSVDLVPGEIRIVDSGSDADATNLASVSPTIVDGRVELGDPDGVIGIFVSMESIADEIELQAFNIFNENNVIPTSIEVTDREMIIMVEPKPGTTLATPGPAARTATPAAAARTPTPAATRTTTSSAASADATSAPAAPITPSATRSAVTATPAANRTPTAEPTATRVPLLGGRTRTATPTPGT